ncbi:MAG: flagellar hook-length control protein FliK, partial [Candidatus Poribacteria bacterium]|nr:flagellar hook-length control protein FliK [Candidatus Poribacteria bacterium]
MSDFLFQPLPTSANATSLPEGVSGENQNDSHSTDRFREVLEALLARSEPHVLQDETDDTSAAQGFRESTSQPINEPTHNQRSGSVPEKRKGITDESLKPNVDRKEGVIGRQAAEQSTIHNSGALTPVHSTGRDGVRDTQGDSSSEVPSTRPSTTVPMYQDTTDHPAKPTVDHRDAPVERQTAEPSRNHHSGAPSRVAGIGKDAVPDTEDGRSSEVQSAPPSAPVPIYEGTPALQLPQVEHSKIFQSDDPAAINAVPQSIAPDRILGGARTTGRRTVRAANRIPTSPSQNEFRPLITYRQNQGKFSVMFQFRQAPPASPAQSGMMETQADFQRVPQNSSGFSIVEESGFPARDVTTIPMSVPGSALDRETNATPISTDGIIIQIQRLIALVREQLSSAQPSLTDRSTPLLHVVFDPVNVEITPHNGGATIRLPRHEFLHPGLDLPGLARSILPPAAGTQMHAGVDASKPQEMGPSLQGRRDTLSTVDREMISQRLIQAQALIQHLNSAILNAVRDSESLSTLEVAVTVSASDIRLSLQVWETAEKDALISIANTVELAFTNGETVSHAVSVDDVIQHDTESSTAVYPAFDLPESESNFAQPQQAAMRPTEKGTSSTVAAGREDHVSVPIADAVVLPSRAPAIPESVSSQPIPTENRRSIREAIVSAIHTQMAESEVENFREFFLELPSLGRVTIRLSHNTDGMTVQLDTETQQGKQVVNEEFPAIQNELHAQGIDVARFEVSASQAQPGVVGENQVERTSEPIPPDRRRLIRQSIVEAIQSQSARLKSDDSRQFPLDLPSVGPVKIQLSYQADEISVRVHPPTRQAEQILTEELPALESNLHSQGIDVSRLEVVAPPMQPPVAADNRVESDAEPSPAEIRRLIRRTIATAVHAQMAESEQGALRKQVLDLPRLGWVTVEITPDEEGVTVSLHPATPQAETLLTDELPAIQNELHSEEVDVGRLEVVVPPMQPFVAGDNRVEPTPEPVPPDTRRSIRQTIVEAIQS